MQIVNGVGVMLDRLAGNNQSATHAGPATPHGPRFHLLRRLGGGGEGTVYLCEDMAEARPDHPTAARSRLAVKIIECGSGADAALLRDRLATALVLPLRTLRHPGVVRYHEVVVGPAPSPANDSDRGEPSTVYIIMDHVDGEPFDTWWRARSFEELPEAFALLGQLCDAVDHLHRHSRADGIPLLHCDIKPSNVIVSGAPGAWRATLVDLNTLGLGDHFQPSASTPGYSPPDPAERTNFTTASDNYALGALLWFLFTRRHPPMDYDPSTLRADLEHVLRAIGAQAPDATIDLVLEMMAYNATDRPESASVWIAPLVDVTTTSSQPITVVPKGVRSRRKRRTMVLVVAVVVVISIVTIGFSQRDDSSDERASTNAPVAPVAPGSPSTIDASGTATPTPDGSVEAPASGTIATQSGSSSTPSPSPSRTEGGAAVSSPAPPATSQQTVPTTMPTATTAPASVADYTWDKNAGTGAVVINPLGRVEQPFVALHPYLDKFTFVAAFDRRPGFCPACTVDVRILRAPNTNNDACAVHTHVAVNDNAKTNVYFNGCQLTPGTRYYAQIYFPGDTANLTVYTNSATPPGGSENHLIAYGASGSVPASSAVRSEIWGHS